jgi:outer membrane receptor protein involved in Fe transport
MSSLRRVCVFGVLSVCLLVSAAPAAGQGVQAGTVSGVVQSTDKLPLPGVTVTAASPNLQGERLAVSDENGVYYLRGLLPGLYQISFDIPGFQPAVREGVEVSVGGIAVVDATMSLAGITETVTVTAEAPSPIAAPKISQGYTKAQIDAMPVGRRPFDIGELSPGVTTNASNANQLTFAGSFGYDNVFMVNGVDVNDNIQGTSNNLFIEDAIQETSVLTHGISAEYGRFSGGVVNIVTRSGGNFFSGSFREGLSNPSWVSQTPLERAASIEHADVLSKTHEGTFGGPVMRDRLWFFGAGRLETSNTSNTFAQNGTGYTRTDKNRRGEVKFTGTIAPTQMVQVSFIENATEEANRSAVGAAALLDAGTLTTRQLPNRLFGASYSGTVQQRYFATLQYSQKHQSFRNNGGTSAALVDSPFMSQGALAGVPGGLWYNAPVLDATDPEQRNNRQVTGSVSTLLSTGSYGSHELKGGAEYFVSTGIGGNSQSSTGYIFNTDYLTANGALVRDAQGAPVPVFTPGVSQIWNYQPTRGAQIDLKTTSVYLQDRWTVTPRLTLDLGTRFEMVRGDATGDITTVDATSIVPRLAASYDVMGNGQTVLYGTYGHYAGKYSPVQFAVNTGFGRPSEVDYVYSGPAGSGSDFAPGFDMANYTQVVFANFPTANVHVADDIKSPLTREFTLGIGRELGSRGHAKATYAWRTMSNFVEDFTDMTTGRTTVPLVGSLANKLFDNTDALYRDYQAMVFQSGYRFGDNLTLDGHYTLQLRNHGNFAGEAANQPGMSSVYGNFPEIYGPALDRLAPEGRLDNFQRHKLRVYGNYAQSLGRFGSLDVTPLWRVNSGAAYSHSASIATPAALLANNPGYATSDVSAATRQTVFFGERGAYSYKGYGVMDLATTYNLAVWRSLRPWFKVEVFNLLDNQKQIAWDRTVAANAASALDANGYRTDVTLGPRYSQATSGAHFPQPYPNQTGGRAFRIAFGVRF